jgi:hypothetical protein
VLILVDVLMDAIAWLREAGVAVREAAPATPNTATRPDAIIEVGEGGTTTRFVVEAKGRAPYPNEVPRLSQLQQALRRDGHPLLIVPFVPEALGAVLTEAGWSWADTCGDFDLRAPGLVLRQRRARAAPKPRPKTLPGGSGSLAIIRSLIRFGEGEEEDAGATSLARQANVSQPRASQVLGQLRVLDLVERSERGRWRPKREALLDRFLAEYNGPGGSEQYLYSLDEPTDVAASIARAPQPNNFAVSADVGPDLVLSWRRPSVVIIYIKRDVDPEELALVPAAGLHDANVHLRIPSDSSVFPTAPPLVSEVQGVEIPLADPSQMIWDLQDLGGSDRLEAAGMLREWLISR